MDNSVYQFNVCFKEDERKVLFKLKPNSPTGCNTKLPFSRTIFDHGKKLSQGRFRLENWKRFFTQMVVELWNRLPRKVVTSTSLAEFKKYLNNTLRRMVALLGIVLCSARSWNWWSFWVLFNSAYPLILRFKYLYKICFGRQACFFLIIFSYGFNNFSLASNLINPFKFFCTLHTFMNRINISSSFCVTVCHFIFGLLFQVLLFFSFFFLYFIHILSVFPHSETVLSSL